VKNKKIFKIKTINIMLKNNNSTLSRSEMMAVIGGLDDGEASCNKSCTVKAADGTSSSIGCYANSGVATPVCLCLDRSNNSQCN
jgi:hypothetical protein